VFFQTLKCSSQRVLLKVLQFILILHRNNVTNVITVRSETLFWRNKPAKLFHKLWNFFLFEKVETCELWIFWNFKIALDFETCSEAAK